MIIKWNRNCVFDLTSALRAKVTNARIAHKDTLTSLFNCEWLLNKAIIKWGLPVFQVIFAKLVPEIAQLRRLSLLFRLFYLFSSIFYMLDVSSVSSVQLQKVPYSSLQYSKTSNNRIIKNSWPSSYYSAKISNQDNDSFVFGGKHVLKYKLNCLPLTYSFSLQS